MFTSLLKQFKSLWWDVFTLNLMPVHIHTVYYNLYFSQNKLGKHTKNTQHLDCINVVWAGWWYMNELVNQTKPEHCKSCVSTFGVAADVRLNECWGVQPKLPALHIWHLPEQIGHLLNDCLLRPLLPFFFLSHLHVLLAGCLFFPVQSTYVHILHTCTGLCRIIFKVCTNKCGGGCLLEWWGNVDHWEVELALQSFPLMRKIDWLILIFGWLST